MASPLVQVRHGALALLLLSFACGRGQATTGMEPRFEVTPASLDFDEAFVTVARERVVVLRNLSRAPLRMQLSSPPPFSVVPTEVLLAGGQVQEVRVEFAPQTTGSWQGVLWVKSEAGETQVALRGAAKALPECGAAGPCRSGHFDVALERCVEELRPDGEACASTCLLGQCVAGECRGQLLSCDDGNACTGDVCQADGSCVHQDVASSCPAPDEPCRVAVCDPATGCGSVLVADGTPCGPLSCEEAHVCVGGQCRVQPLPEGASCGTRSPCQAPGRCEGRRCVQPPPQALSPVWTLYRPGRPSSRAALLQDEQGTLYEHLGELRAVDRDGVVLHSRSTSTDTAGLVSYSRGKLLLAGSAVVVRRASDLERVWRVEAGQEMTLVPPGMSLVEASFTHVLESPSGDLLALLQVNLAPTGGGPSILQSRLVWLESETGRPLRVVPWPAPLSSPVLTEQGLLVVLQVSWSGPQRQLAFDMEGVLRWEVELPGFPSSVVTAGEHLWWLETSAQSSMSFVSAPSEQGPPGMRSELPGLQVGTLVMSPQGEGFGLLPPGTNSEHVVVGLSSVGGAPLWSHLLPRERGSRWVSEPLLLSNGALLLVTGEYLAVEDRDVGVELLALSSRGEELLRCALPEGAYIGRALLHEGRLVLADHTDYIRSMALHAFDVPGLELAPAGWVMPGGNPGRTLRPR